MVSPWERELSAQRERPAFLVADAARNTRDFLRDSISSLQDDAEVTEAETGEEVLNALAARRIDLAFVDPSLPGLDNGKAINRDRFFHQRCYLVLLGTKNSHIAENLDVADLSITKPFHRRSIGIAMHNWEVWRQPMQMVVAARSPAVMDLLREGIRSQGLLIVVHEVRDAASALLAARRQDVDFLIVHEDLKDMAALEVLEIIQRQNLKPKVILTGRAPTKALLQQIKRLNGAGFLPSTLTPDKIGKGLLKAIGITDVVNLTGKDS